MPSEIVITDSAADELSPEAKQAAHERRMQRWRRIHVLAARRDRELDQRWSQLVQAAKARQERSPLSKRFTASPATPNGA